MGFSDEDKVLIRNLHDSARNSLWDFFNDTLTDNVDFVTFSVTCLACIFNYKIMPAALANTFLFILQGSALADLRCSGRF